MQAACSVVPQKPIINQNKYNSNNNYIYYAFKLNKKSKICLVCRKDKNEMGMKIRYCIKIS